MVQTDVYLSNGIEGTSVAHRMPIVKKANAFARTSADNLVHLTKSVAYKLTKLV